MSLFFPVAVAYAEGGAAAGNQSAGILGFAPFIAIIFIFYFLLIRPQQKSAKKHQELLQKLEKGDNVITRGGLHGRIVNVKEDIITVEIADNVRVKVERSSIGARKAEGS
ncbi:MAG: preprotein translocase subunit YajC [Deltaproteobacteria bacterium]|nr:preprotein translocase subunit YajC [Deltaproteobacteria bacterium]